jgi:hypothetical protein
VTYEVAIDELGDIRAAEKSNLIANRGDFYGAEVQELSFLFQASESPNKPDRTVLQGVGYQQPS